MQRVRQSYRNGELVIVIDCFDLARSARLSVSEWDAKRLPQRAVLLWP
jgi:hypothetical protein